MGAGTAHGSAIKTPSGETTGKHHWTPLFNFHTTTPTKPLKIKKSRREREISQRERASPPLSPLFIFASLPQLITTQTHTNTHITISLSLHAALDLVIKLLQPRIYVFLNFDFFLQYPNLLLLFLFNLNSSICTILLWFTVFYFIIYVLLGFLWFLPFILP